MICKERWLIVTAEKNIAKKLSSERTVSHGKEKVRERVFEG